MEEYMKRIGEITVMDDGASSAQNEDIEVTSSESSIKRRKVDSPPQALLHSRPSDFQLEIQCRRVLNCSFSPAVSGNSDDSVSSLCSSNDSSDQTVKDSFRNSDLKEESFVTDMSKLSNGGFSRETTPSSDISVDSERMESSTPKKKPTSAAGNSRRNKPTTKIPSAIEIEDFFSVAEKYEQKRFSEKYNYDIVKDVPLEGRYQWVKLKP